MIVEMMFTPAKLDKLADLFLDLAKGLLLAALAAPAISAAATLGYGWVLFMVMVGLAFALLFFVDAKKKRSK